MAKVLIVDDNDFVRRAYARILSHAGHTVAEHDSGEDLIDVLRDHAPDLVLLDLNLPVMRGDEAVSSRAVLRELESRKVPIIVVSGLEDHVVRRRAERINAVATLSKPVEAGTLVEAVQKALG